MSRLLLCVSHFNRCTECPVERYQQGSFEEAEASFRSQIKLLEDDISRQKVKT